MTNQEIMQYTGEGMFVLLIVILLLKPIAYYLKKPNLLKYRRYLGWATGLVGFTHLSYWVAYYMESITFLVKSLSHSWFLLGLFAMVSLFLMSISSNNKAVKYLGGKLWKKIQVYGIHILVILGLLHGHLAIRGFDPTILLWAAPMLLLLIWRIKVAVIRWALIALLALGIVRLIPSGGTNVQDVGQEVQFPTSISDNTSIQGYTAGYAHNIFGQDSKIPHTWTEEDFRICDGEPANLNTLERVYCKNGDVHEKDNME